MITVIAKPPNRPAPALELRHGETRPCTVNCAELLATHECLVAIISTHVKNVTVVGTRVVSPTTFEVSITAPWPVNTTFIDSILEIQVQTSQGTLNVALTVRIYGVV